MKLAVVTDMTTEATGAWPLAKSVELIRASILYADEITLVNPIASVVGQALPFLARGDAELLSVISLLDDETIRRLGGKDPRNRPMILQAVALAIQQNPVLQRRPRGPAIEQRSELRDGLLDELAQVRAKWWYLLQKSGGDELLPAAKAGILKLGMPAYDGNIRATFEGLIDSLKTLLQDPAMRLLLDDSAGALARSLLGEGQIELHQLTLKHAGEAAVGSGLIARLPALPQAPVAELLDLRRDLEPSLVRYRAAVPRLADELASRFFDQESAAAIEDLWAQEVGPALVEIQEGFAEHGLVREVARTLGADLKSLIREGAALYVGLGTLASVNGWIAAAAGVAGPLAEAVARAATVSRTERRELKGRELYFLYEVNRRLQDR